VAHEFDGSYARGKQFEAEQDAFYARWFAIEKVDRATDRTGIDRYFTPKKQFYCPDRIAVEYKGDDRAAETGNLFIEVTSVSSTGKPGWAIRCASDWISIYVPPRKEFYILATKAMLQSHQAAAWLMRYPVNAAVNNGYDTWGVCVPRKVVAESGICLRVAREGTVCGEQGTMDWATRI